MRNRPHRRRKIVQIAKTSTTKEKSIIRTKTKVRFYSNNGLNRKLFKKKKKKKKKSNGYLIKFCA